MYSRIMIGVCSYLLIGYWSHRLSASKSALKAVVVNRLSDGLLLWGVLWIWWNTGSLEYDLITLSYCSYDNFSAGATESSAFLSTAILIGAMGKSAQIGFHVWLADAMEGWGLNSYFFNFKKQLSAHLSLFNLNLRFFSSNKKELPELTKEQKEIVAGLLMSDGGLRNPNNNKRKTGNYRIEFTFKTAFLEYCKWVKFVLLGTICTDSVPTPYPKENPTQYWFATRSHPYLTSLRPIWYGNDNKKVVPNDDYLEENFSEVSLAHAIMGDGYFEKDSQTIYICTECFTYEEVVRFNAFLLRKFGLVATTKKRHNGYRLRFSSAGDNLNKLLFTHWPCPWAKAS